jgi:hypothetical protein
MRTNAAAILNVIQTVRIRISRIGAVIVLVFAVASTANAQAPDTPAPATPAAEKSDSPREMQQAELEAAFAKMLSGATLEGNFTNTSGRRDPTKLSSEKYTLGEVKKLGGNVWLIPARIQYGEHDVTLPIALPIQWAGDTPVIVVDNLGLPGFGTVSARVMFFADHYAGYWKHGRSGGHLFGVIRRKDQADERAATPSDAEAPAEPDSRSSNTNR